jgi:hypothetical protein
MSGMSERVAIKSRYQKKEKAYLREGRDGSH